MKKIAAGFILGALVVGNQIPIILGLDYVLPIIANILLSIAVGVTAIMFIVIQIKTALEES